MASTQSRRLADLELGKGSPHRGIARESGVDHRPRHTSKRRDGPPTTGDGNGTPPPFQPVGDRGGRSLRLNALEEVNLSRTTQPTVGAGAGVCFGSGLVDRGGGGSVGQ